MSSVVASGRITTFRKRSFTKWSQRCASCKTAAGKAYNAGYLAFIGLLANNQRRRCLKKTWKRTGNKRSVGDMKLVTREDQEEDLEHACLSGDAAFSDETEGRRFSTEGDLYRSEHQEGIAIRSCTLEHSVVFPIKHKFFLLLKGIIYRTATSHTLEVAQIARTIARALGLNEDLTEAIALGHELGAYSFWACGRASYFCLSC